MTTKAAARSLLLLGIAGVIILILTGAVTTGGQVVSRMLDGPGGVTLRDRFPALVRMLVIAAYISLWMLLPYWAAFMQQRGLSSARHESAVALVTIIMLVVPATYAYLSELVVLPALIDSKPRRDSAILLLVVPMYQWAVLVVGSGARRFFLEPARRR